MDTILLLFFAIGISVLSIWFGLKEREKQRIARRDYYRKYLKSDAWKRKRYVVLKRDKGICQHCGAKAEQVHHKKYARNIGTEPIKWLESICKDCHYKIHSKHNKSSLKPVRYKKTKRVKTNKSTGFDKVDNYISVVESKYPESSLQTNWSWPVKMNLCPSASSNEPLIEYFNSIQKEMIFCEDKNKGGHPKGLDTYHKKWKVIENSISDEKDRLWVIIENFELSVKYLLIEITFHKELKIRVYKDGWIVETRSNVFLHNRFSRSFVSLNGAKKMLFEKQGKEWVGAETVDDWIL